MTVAPHTRYYVGFNRVSGIGPSRLAQLIQRCGSAEAAWHATPDEMGQAGLDRKSRESLLKARQSLDLDAELARVFRAGAHVLTIEDAEYPRILAQIAAPPPLLYVRGSLSVLDEWALAVVGTRSPTTYGKEATRRIVTDLARSGLTIVSGLAVGIDGVAHQAALEAGGRTIGVLGCGVDVLYPDRNIRLAEEMLECGALLSDYPLGTRPYPSNFPPRNRIISGLTVGTLVTEAGEKSGALITVDFALEQGRDVFAVPGTIFSQKSQGVHQLIRNGAELVTCAQDILESLNLMNLRGHQEVAVALPEDPTEAALMSHLSAEPQHVDILCRTSGMSPSLVSSTLTLLELKGYARHVGNMEYVRR
ncbi:MAG: DNA-protecting protein DprA [Chloroflexaceae bacterium]|nr:DNA-protecting protein DprA [Chloroflexaceae bacterium]